MAPDPRTWVDHWDKGFKGTRKQWGASYLDKAWATVYLDRTLRWANLAGHL